MTDDFNLIESRRIALRKERARLAEQVAALEAEETELDSAERTLMRLRGSVKREKGDYGRPIDNEAKSAAIPRKGTKRPSGVFPTPVMVDTVLADAEQEGKPGLSGKEIMVAIERRFWPGVGWNSILPETARLVKAGRLRREDGIYKRVKAEKAVGQLSLGDQPTALSNNPERDREAGRGGGT